MSTFTDKHGIEHELEICHRPYGIRMCGGAVSPKPYTVRIDGQAQCSAVDRELAERMAAIKVGYMQGKTLAAICAELGI